MRAGRTARSSRPARARRAADAARGRPTSTCCAPAPRPDRVCSAGRLRRGSRRAGAPRSGARRAAPHGPVAVRRLARSAAEHRARADPGRAVDLGEADAGGAGDLALPGLTAELEDDLVDLAQARGADRLAVGQAAAVCVDGQAAVALCRAALDQRLLLAVLAQAGLGEVRDLRARLGVLELR